MRTKYGSKKKLLDGHLFDSQKEANRYLELKLLLRTGDISDLELQPKFCIAERCKDPATGRWMPARHYIADFRYRRGEQVYVEDVKGFRTDLYRLKRHLFLLRYGAEIIFMET